MFRANYQQKVQNSIIEDMPHDQCVVVMDFSENMSLQSQDEIESAHWNIRQVTIHPIYIVRHSVDSTYDNPKLQKESLIVISDSLTHDSNAVQVFTYKIWPWQGPSDGLGAAIKGRISRLILAGNVINNAYQVYLALQRNKSENIIQKIVYVPKRVIDQLKPDKPTMIKPLKGTQSFHCIRTFKKGSKLLLCSDLSCSCSECIDSNQQGPCPLIQFRKDDILMDLTTGKRLLRADAENLDIAVAESIVLFVNQADSNDEMIKAFEEKIHEKGVKLRGETPSDGNCLFWAISDQMDRINKNVYTHTQLRRMVVDHIQNLSDDEKSELAKFIPDDDLPLICKKWQTPELMGTIFALRSWPTS
ncbi:unnamed protein product [Mytilus edulis]|uniref:OTU domain-containing protein n=1 Tax=Mytilus edulis TaxID=6550 RepID=A0A8S3T8Z0_MYTED|nr:unnamed protein product [Mytilus edulis]